MMKFRSGLTIFVLASATLPSLGCATHAAENRRLMDQLGRAERSDLENQHRISELEWRLRDLEAQRDSRRDVSRELTALVDRVDALLAHNQRLSSAALLEPSPSCGVDRPDDGADPKAQLRYWAERVRDGSHGFRGGLTPEQNAALNVLLKRERSLDPKNPWPDL